MLPAQWRDVARDLVGRADVSQRHFEIASVPQDDGGDEQVEAGGAISLAFEPPITQFAELVKEERAGERVAGFALVEARPGAPAQSGVAQPAEHEHRAFQSAKLAQREGQPALSGTPGTPAPHSPSRSDADQGPPGQPEHSV